MTDTPAVTVLRDFSTGDIRMWHLGPDRSLPGAPIVIEEVALSELKFREDAWQLVLHSLETFSERAVAESPKKPPDEARRAQREHRQLQKRFISLDVLREPSDSLLLHLCEGKRGYWEEAARATIPVPSSNEEFLQALEELGFFSLSRGS